MKYIYDGCIVFGSWDCNLWPLQMDSNKQSQWEKPDLVSDCMIHNYSGLFNNCGRKAYTIYLTTHLLSSRNFGSSCGCKLRSTCISTEEDLNCAFSSAQDEIQSLILQRNELQHKLYKAVEEFIVEVDDLPLSERLETLKVGSKVALYLFYFMFIRCCQIRLQFWIIINSNLKQSWDHSDISFWNFNI